MTVPQVRIVLAALLQTPPVAALRIATNVTRQLRRNGTQQRLGGERIEFLLLQRHKLIVALPVTIGLLPI